ncbi:MAG TPA: triose-phosphate isomerase [Stellaceae bacterium]|jgi:triosephosphate isomerase
MANRTKLVAGNWKMNGLRADGVALAGELARRMRETPGGGAVGCELLVCPPATLLAAVHAIVAGSGIALGGQDCHAAPKGAFTGDISAEMLVDAGCTHVILGHSERRQGHGETDDQVRVKLLAAHRAGLTPILCIGETRQQREAGDEIPVVTAQLAGSIPDGFERDRLIVAYEPVWAIGTGLSATLEDIAAMHAAIRADLAPGARILYGGSVNPANAAAILGLPDVDGALVGGASLDAEAFWAVARACG